MAYLEKNIGMRLEPKRIRPSTNSIICVTANYLTKSLSEMMNELQNNKKGYISNYATGRDYHKIIRKQLVKLAQKIEEEIGPSGYRVFTDSAPIYEKPLASYSGLGWIGKNTLLINKAAGSFFFLGEIFTDLKLPAESNKIADLCGTCTNCIDICPTGAIVAPYKLDSRKCISYLTIEYSGKISEMFMEKMGNRIYGCDDCLAICPWNKFAKLSSEIKFYEIDKEFSLDILLTLDEFSFKKKFAKSPIKRIGRERFIRNCCIAAGNSKNKIYKKQLKYLLDNEKSEIILHAANWANERLV